MINYNVDKIYAHTKIDKQNKIVLPESEWQSLESHLTAVSIYARDAARQFGADNLALAAGLLHDIGKATEDFQLRLHGERMKVDHKTEGGRQAIVLYKELWGKLLAYVICGHHGGLPDDVSIEGAAGLQEMLKQTPNALLINVPELPDRIEPKNMTISQSLTHQSFYITMLIRMVFSALVDADYLDTEAFMDPQSAAHRLPFPSVRRPEFNSKKKHISPVNVDIAKVGQYFK